MKMQQGLPYACYNGLSSFVASTQPIDCVQVPHQLSFCWANAHDHTPALTSAPSTCVHLHLQVVDEFTFKLLFSVNYYPALQELSIIRPIRFISPKNLPTAPDEKSCPPTANLFWPTNVTEFRCGATGAICAPDACFCTEHATFILSWVPVVVFLLCLTSCACNPTSGATVSSTISNVKSLSDSSHA